MEVNIRRDYMQYLNHVIDAHYQKSCWFVVVFVVVVVVVFKF